MARPSDNYYPSLVDNSTGSGIGSHPTTDRYTHKPRPHSSYSPFPSSFYTPSRTPPSASSTAAFTSRTASAVGGMSDTNPTSSRDSAHVEHDRQPPEAGLSNSGTPTSVKRDAESSPEFDTESSKRPRSSFDGPVARHERKPSNSMSRSPLNGTMSREHRAYPDLGATPSSTTATSSHPPPAPATQPASGRNIAGGRASTSGTGVASASASGSGSSHAVAGAPTTGPKRAAQACLRCRKQKLRCTGGWPCKRCDKSKNQCDFGGPTGAPGTGGAAVRTGGVDSAQRIENLEASVATLLAGMSGGNVPGGSGGGSGNGGAPSGPPSGSAHPSSNSFEHDGRTGFGGHPHNASWNSGGQLPPPLRPYDHRYGPGPGTRNGETSRVSPEAGSVGSGGPTHVHFGASPDADHSPSQYSGSNFGGHGHSPNSVLVPPPKAGSNSGATGHGSASKTRRMASGQKAEDRLRALTDASFEAAPFRPLVPQHAGWDNREAPHRSPQPSSASHGSDSGLETAASASYDRRRRDDPISAEIVDEQTAEVLFGFFVQYCHPFMPIVDIVPDNAFAHIRHYSPALLSSILAVAARFYVRYEERFPSSLPSLPRSAPSGIAALAEWHLAQTLLRKRHSLADVQAILLLAAWGLHSEGSGLDAWIVTGHASRIGRRLGLPIELAKATEIAGVASPQSPEWVELTGCIGKWRTWLGCFTFDAFLSLGFGRPQAPSLETVEEKAVDETAFFNMRLSQPMPIPGTLAATSLYGDAYVASLVQLTRIGRDLSRWGKAITEQPATTEEDIRGRDASLRQMLRELNARLDEWCKHWIWPTSPYLQYLGPSARLCRLQAEHMRLCINSFAVKAAPEEDKVAADCLARGLRAAMATIQTHHESSQTDLALSFATDYLTITLAQAAVFLIRIANAASVVQHAAKVDVPVVIHYLKMSVEVLKASDLSETRLSTYLARILVDMARAARIPGMGDDDDDGASGMGDHSRPTTSSDSVYDDGDHRANGASSASRNGTPIGGATLGMTPLHSYHAQPGSLLDPWDADRASGLEHLLGLPGDSAMSMPGPGRMFGEEFGRYGNGVPIGT